MKNFKQKGATLTLVAPREVRSGDGVLVGSIFSVASGDAADGEEFEGVAEGVFELPKAVGAVTLGAKLYWNETAQNITTVASGNKHIGVAITSASADAAVVDVKLGVVA